MEWWYRVRRVWIGLATRLRIRKTGLWKLRQEVRTCEYEDVRVMWDMLSKSGYDAGRSGKKRGERGHVWTSLEWASKRAPYNLCRSF